MTCSLADGDADLGGRSRKQITLAVKELREQHRAGGQARDVNALALGRFMREVDAKGELARQMLRDAEARAVSSPQSPAPPAVTQNLRLVKTDARQLSSRDATSSTTPSPSSLSVLGVDDAEALLDEVLPCELLD